jgi:hypothetical protein
MNDPSAQIIESSSDDSPFDDGAGSSSFKLSNPTTHAQTLTQQQSSESCIPCFT